MIYDICKCIVLILAVMAVMVTFIDSNIDSYAVCMEKLAVGGFNGQQTGQDAFIHAYQNLTLHFTNFKGREKLNLYFRITHKVATQGYTSLPDILNPEKWCEAKYRNEYSVCKSDLEAGGFKRTNMKSLNALRHAFYHLTKLLVKKKNAKTIEYYEYLFIKYSPNIVNRKIISPSVYCRDNDYGRLHVVKDNDGNPIDLNNYEDCEDDNNDGNDDKYKSQIQGPDCLKQLKVGGFNDKQTGQAAFVHAYQNLTSRFTAIKGREVVRKYMHQIYGEATLGYTKLTFIQCPNEWCKKNYSNDPNCINELIVGSFKRKNMTSIQALGLAFYHLTNKIVEKKNYKTKQYFEYLLNVYSIYLYTKNIKCPKEYCGVQGDGRLNTAEDIDVTPIDYNIQYENNATDKDGDEYEDQDQALFNDAGEGSSHSHYIYK